MANSSIRYGEGVTREVGMVSLCFCLKSECQVDELTGYNYGRVSSIGSRLIYFVYSIICAKFRCFIFSSINHSSLSTWKVDLTTTLYISYSFWLIPCIFWPVKLNEAEPENTVIVLIQTTSHFCGNGWLGREWWSHIQLMMQKPCPL